MAIKSNVIGEDLGAKLVTMCEHCWRNASLVTFSSSKWSVKGCASDCLKHVGMWPVRSGGRLPAVTLWLSVCVCACFYACLRVCQEPLHAHPGLQGFLTYILLSTISSKEICVNQLPLWPACLLPVAGRQSRSADLIKTEETISSDFHFFEPPPPTAIPTMVIIWWQKCVLELAHCLLTSCFCLTRWVTWTILKKNNLCIWKNNNYLSFNWRCSHWLKTNCKTIMVF